MNTHGFCGREAGVVLGMLNFDPCPSHTLAFPSWWQGRIGSYVKLCSVGLLGDDNYLHWSRYAYVKGKKIHFLFYYSLLASSIKGTGCPHCSHSCCLCLCCIYAKLIGKTGTKRHLVRVNQLDYSKCMTGLIIVFCQRAGWQGQALQPLLMKFGLFPVPLEAGCCERRVSTQSPDAVILTGWDDGSGYGRLFIFCQLWTQLSALVHHSFIHIAWEATTARMRLLINVILLKASVSGAMLKTNIFSNLSSFATKFSASFLGRDINKKMLQRAQLS